jgi:hypothetical protein
MTTQNQDPLEFLKSFWGNVGFPIPGMVAPTLDTDELGRRIADLKAVEGWLKANLSMLQMTIQGLEVQRATLAAVQSMGQAASGEGVANPFANPALWPWNLVQPGPGANTAAAPDAAGPASSEHAEPKR